MNLKRCPTCRTWVFEDMDICYACMYRFGSDLAREEAVQRETPLDESDPVASASESACVTGVPAGNAERDGVRQTVSLAGWNVLIEAMDPASEGGRLHLMIEPASKEAGSEKCGEAC